MPINSTHGDYDASVLVWSRARDVLSGEDAVKAAGPRYLPRLESQSDAEYEAYKARACFFGATARTLEEYLDLVFRRAPVIGAGQGKALQAFAADCDLWGLDFARYARRVVGEVLSVGRAGSLVLWDKAATRPCVSFWRPEDIIDWSVERVGQVLTLVRVVLRDGGRLRVLNLVDSVCVQEFWRQEGAAGEARGSSEGWVLDERAALRRDGGALSFIPFVFHGPRGSQPEPDRLPLADIIAANLDHYRLDADLKHGLHFAALPTAWVSGFDKEASLRIGSSTAWVSDAADASAGFLEFSGAGLEHIERAMEKVERRMALLGARMLEVRSPDGEAAAGRSAELCGLGSIVASLNGSLSRVLRMAQWWIEGGEVEAKDARFIMNSDLGAHVMSGEEISAVVAAWRAGAISRDTMLERLKRGEVLPDGRSVAQERALIHGRAS